MTDRTDAVARMLETIDLLAKMTASMSDRLDTQSDEIAELKVMLLRAQQGSGYPGNVEGSAAKGTSADVVQVHLILHELSQKITDLKALYGEADRHFDQVKADSRKSLPSTRWRWLVPLFLVLSFFVGLWIGALG